MLNSSNVLMLLRKMNYMHIYIHCTEVCALHMLIIVDHQADLSNSI